MNKKTLVVIHEDGFTFLEDYFYTDVEMDFAMCASMVKDLGWEYCWPDEVNNYSQDDYNIVQLDDAINPINGCTLVNEMINEHSSRLYDHQMACLENGV